MEIDDFCLENNIDLHVFWTPREFNKIADYMSRARLNDHYSFLLNAKMFMELENTFGTHSIDRFASSDNVLVSSRRYNSKYFEPESEWINAFSCDWRLDKFGSLENNWVHPPYSIVGKAIQHILNCQATATIIFPIWHSASWWPTIVPLLRLHRSIDLGYCSDVLSYPESSSIDVSHLPRGRLMALRLDLK